MSFESFIIDIIEKRRSHPVIEKILYFFSYLYRELLEIRNAWYDRGWIRIHKVPAKVVSIGNIVAGGTGKTPFVYFLAKKLEKTDKKVGIVSRGYRSKIEKTGLSLQISKGKGPLCNAEEAGDEPYFLAQKTRASIWVGKNKLKGAISASKEGVDIILLDDGMQYRKLFRDIEIVIMDGKDLFGKGYFLPRGFLRDSPERLKCADLIIVNHVNGVKEWEEIEKELHLFTSSPLVGIKYSYKIDAKIKNPNVAIFCGIAKPQRFEEAVETLGLNIVDRLFIPDHAKISEETLELFAKSSRDKGAKILLCTEKDWVKLRKTSTTLPIFPLELDIEVVKGLSHWQDFLKKLLNN